MPELPEVTWMVDRIRRKFKGCLLKRIKVISGRYMNREIKGIDIFKRGIVDEVENKGKFVYIILHNGVAIWITLGLSGVLTEHKDKYARIKFNTDCGYFYLNDVRNFGTITISSVKSLERKLNTLGPDPLHDRFSYKEFKERYLRQRQNQKIGDVLLKQDLVSGIGNYLRAEILYRARVSPHCKLKDIPESYLKKIYGLIYSVAKESYKHQTKHGLHTYDFKVYKKRFDPKGKPVIGEPFKNKRTMWWVPLDVMLKC